MTCTTINNKKDIFWVSPNLGAEKFEELWDLCRGNWEDKKLVVLEHDGFYDCGEPINPKFVSIEFDNGKEK